MADGIMVLAGTGGGKSTSLGHIPAEDLKADTDIEGLNPAETLLINVKNKPLPWKRWRDGYETITLNERPVTANYLVSTDYAFITKTMKYFNDSRPDIKNVVIDDFQYLMADEFMANALKGGYEKFSKMAKNAYDILDKGLHMRDDITFIVLSHSEESKNGYKMKTVGKMLDEKITPEGLFTTVLYCKSVPIADSNRAKKVFVTNDDGEYPAKSPIGMFEDIYIPNDMGLVVRASNNYYHGND